MKKIYPKRRHAASMAALSVGIGLVLVCGPHDIGGESARAASSASGHASGASDTGMSFSDADAAESENYWTPDKIAAAVPADGVTVTPQKQSPSLGASAVTSVFEPVYWIGRLYYTAGGIDYACTASSIKSDSKLVIATAGHCLYHKGEFSTNLRFIPAWDGANKPLLTWGANDYQVPRAWRYQEDQQHDAGFVQLKPQRSWLGAKQYLADRAGATATNFGLAKTGLHYEAFGYEQVSGFTSHPLLTCSGNGYRRFSQFSLLSINDCAMVGGGSGGPVYHESGKGVNGTQVGVVSSVIPQGEHSIMTFAPWGDAEYQVFRTVDAWGR
ncbi:peptidase [Clavibacter michiganensis subsp. michiganensis]|nr:peptidase [Clavibacter michiganensis subsp. michiganensis]MWJ26587.1 peptidase [Clavibacter michiganensis subsp. michiganensis]MWJ39990.1 peptidase [Clavibacter michiganensis subsp. michiganensis]MWJ83896.1 peptidase [Clavibacter michiganensis subsp. michiganensis]MWK63604.1 peptidase [Clavibacter michiganensis subsp. michiganensis]